MPNTTISFDFPEYKLKAIEQALQEKQEQKTIQDMLIEHVEGLYQRNVPAQARKYLDTMLGDPEQTAVSGQTAAQEQEPDSRRPYRRRENPARQREAALSSAPPEQSAPEQSAPDPEQSPGMTMSM